MNLTLARFLYRQDGIFGRLTDENYKQLAVTLEHAYKTDAGGWMPKIPAGTWTCVRGRHRLDGMLHDFETFEVTGVPGHTGLLFHKGNWNKDSKGCILLGADTGESTEGQMITNSLATFGTVMGLQSGIEQFTLTVLDSPDAGLPELSAV